MKTVVPTRTAEKTSPGNIGFIILMLNKPIVKLIGNITYWGK